MSTYKIHDLKHISFNENISGGEHCFVCSPYSADTKEELDANVRRAQYGCLYALYVLGKAPYAPHLINTQILPNNKEGKRLGIEIGFFYMRGTLLIVGDVITEGMAKEIEWASSCKLDIKHVSQKTLDSFIEELKPDFSENLKASHF